jgi:hypothetical protein
LKTIARDESSNESSRAETLEFSIRIVLAQIRPRDVGIPVQQTNPEIDP